MPSDEEVPEEEYVETPTQEYTPNDMIPISPEDEYLGSPASKQENTTAAFYFKVLTTPSTLRVGNLDKDEVGIPKYAVRTLKDFELISRMIIKNEMFADYFKELSENMTASSLSKDALLLKLPTLTRKEVAQVTKARRENRGWFGRKSDGGIE